MYQASLIASIVEHHNKPEILSVNHFLEQNKELVFNNFLSLYSVIEEIKRDTSHLPNFQFLLDHINAVGKEDLIQQIASVKSATRFDPEQVIQYAHLQKKLGLQKKLINTINNTMSKVSSSPISEIDGVLDDTLFSVNTIDRLYNNDKTTIFVNDNNGMEDYIQKERDIINARKEGEMFQWDLGIKGLAEHNIYIRPKSSFIVYGAFVGNGKSTLARKTIISALKQQKNVFICSTEMSEREILSYILSDISTKEVGLIPQKEIEKLEFTGNNESKYFKLLSIFGSEAYGKLVVSYPTTSEYSVEDAVQDCIIHHKTKDRIDLFVLDYLTNIKPIRGKYSIRDENTLYNNAIRDVKRDLLKHSIPSIVTAQLNRKAQREFITTGKFPKSDSIYLYSEFEKSATQMIFVGTNDDTDRAKGIFRLQIAKNRNGSFNDEDILLLMNKKTSSFNDYQDIDVAEDIEDEIEAIFDIFKF